MRGLLATTGTFSSAACLKDAVVSQYPLAATFESFPFIAAWLRMATGHQDNLPTHYPRVAAAPDQAGENFKWYTENERDRKVRLGELAADPGLPFPNSR